VRQGKRKNGFGWKRGRAAQRCPKFQYLPLAMPDSGVAGLMEVATAPAAFSFQYFSIF
jgi:hypothetical protein